MVKKKVSKKPKVVRHKWQQEDRGAKCKACGILLRASAGKRGGCSVYFVMPGENGAMKISGDKTPPCRPRAAS